MNKFTMTKVMTAIEISNSPAAMARTAANDGATQSDPTAQARKPAGKTESPGEYGEDAVIATRMKAAVVGDAALRMAEANVETSKRVVQLSSFVRSHADIDKPDAHAKAGKGATSVNNDMVVKGQQ